MRRLLALHSAVAKPASASGICTFHPYRNVMSVASVQNTSAEAGSPLLAPVTTALIKQEHLDAFFSDCITCIPKLLSDDLCEALKHEIASIVDVERERLLAAPKAHGGPTTFDTYSQKHTSDEYFMTSGDKVRFFFEAGVDSTRPENMTVANLNKVGHGLHLREGSLFRSFTGHPFFSSLLRRVGMRSPSVVQSMYIMKSPKVGAAVQPHQDSTWLHTSPMSCVGVWFALDDCDVNNACLMAIKGSHFTHGALSARCKLVPGSTLKSELHGHLPIVDAAAEMVPVECPKGSLVMFNGQCIHGSAQNLSERQRHAYVFHAVDDHCSWSDENWMAPTAGRLRL